MRTDLWVQIFRSNDAVTHTFLNLTEGEAMTLVDLVRGQWSHRYLISDASPDLAQRIDAEYRTSWYTRGLPEGDPTKED